MTSVRNLYRGLDWQRAAADADFTHRIGYPDALALERLPQRQHHVAFDIVHSVGIGDPEGQGKLHPGLGEFDENAVRRLALDGTGRRRGDVDRQLANQPRIGVVIGAEPDLHQRVLVGIGPVDDLLRHQILVRDQEFAAVAGGDRDIARLHRADAPRAVADRDEVAGFHRLTRSRMMPLMKLATIFCKPKPIPTPAAPEKIASAERLMPTALMTTATANIIRASRIILTSSTWIDGVRSPDRVIRLSTKLLAMLVNHSATTRSTPSLISNSGVSRSPPSTTETESSASMVGSSCPSMLSAATSHADNDTTRTINSLRMTDVMSRMIKIGRAHVAATASR